MVAPACFIPLAEETGLIAGIGDWVIRTACRQAKAWHDAGFKDLQVAVNLSVHQLTRVNFDAEVAAVLADAGLPPQYLELEITESTSMKHPERTVVLLARLKQMGMSIAIDDFGTGYSNLSYLKRFPVDRLKLDRAFVSDITSKPEDSELARAIIAMARSLHLTVVVEGVDEEVYTLADAQHYYFALNKNTDDRLVAKLQAVLDELRAKGRVEAIAARYR
ncbi:EAL domain-containing protein [Noviherbaspirillum autotrophicum]|uniref:EAL domain-containing protein n=1 Tax=Noviherbaspirillum autotrophicum TaxID=709839 RepID=UPI0006935EB4|nr:EAL domain-containing protein [Noviherbaspirillum autotrophicum]